MNVKIFIDLDEVLADWLTPALTIFGVDPVQVHAAWDKLTPRPWNVFDVIDVPPSQAWERLNFAGEQFWATLPKMPHADRLLHACEAIGETTILTSPSLHPSSYAGKVMWLDHHFGNGFAHKRALIGASKHVVARPGAVLIDDSPAHCNAWEAEGGHAILFPGYGNVKHRFRNNPLYDVLARLEMPTRQLEYSP